MMPIFSSFILVLITNSISPNTPASVQMDCDATISAFVIEAPESILEKKEEWLSRIETQCPKLPQSLLGAKRKSMEPCQTPLNAACREVLEGWQAGLKSYQDLQTSLKSLPEWAKPYWEIAQTWWQYFKGLLN